MPRHVQDIIIGQGIAGSTLAWTLYWAGRNVLVVDRDDDCTASKVAAGLVTPATGKRVVRSSEFDTNWPFASTFYCRVEQETGVPLFEERTMIRVFEDTAARQAFFDRSEESASDGITEWEGQLQRNGKVATGIEMAPAGRLNVRRYLAVTRDFFTSRQSHTIANINADTELEFRNECVHIASLDVTADHVLLCLGANPTALAPDVPNNPARGDVLQVRIPEYDRSEVVHRSVWVAPNPDGTQTVGATYDWGNLSNDPSAAGRAEILGKLGRLVTGPIPVIGHVAAVRPTMKDYQPVIGPHPNHPRLYVFNGLGSKGTLRAPLLAENLRDAIEHDTAIRNDVSYSRLQQKIVDAQRSRPLTTLAQELVKGVVRPGDHVVDATVGNGFDTCFLASTVTETGRVVGYDVQPQAIEATAKRLLSQGLNNVELRCESHEEIANLPNGSVAAVMFNLGYLPRGDHTITTRAETTFKAVTAAILAIKLGGVVSILCYRGHSGGPEEYATVCDVLQTFENAGDITVHESSPPKATSPVLVTFCKS